MQINAKLAINQLDGAPLKLDHCVFCGQAVNTSSEKFYTIGTAISSILMRPNQNASISAIKALEISRKLYSQDSVEIDLSDLTEVKKAVEEDKTFTPLIKGQVLIHLEELIAKKEEKEQKQ